MEIIFQQQDEYLQSQTLSVSRGSVFKAGIAFLSHSSPSAGYNRIGTAGTGHRLQFIWTLKPRLWRLLSAKQGQLKRALRAWFWRGVLRNAAPGLCDAKFLAKMCRC